MSADMEIPGAGIAAENCKHQCGFGCGNEYEFVVTTVSDSTTQFLCVPHYIETASMMLAAVMEPDDPVVMAAVEQYDADTVTPTGRRGRKASLISAIDNEGLDEVFDDFEPDVEES